MTSLIRLYRGLAGFRRAGRLMCLAAALAIAVALSVTAASPALAASGGTELSPGQQLTAGQYLQNGNFKLLMQSDGNFVLYACGTAVWASGTVQDPGASIAMQYDGNLVIYSPAHVALWASNTAGNPGAFLVVTTYGNVAVDTPGGRVLWNTGTTSAPDCSDILPANTIVGNVIVTSQNGEYHFRQAQGSGLEVYNNSGGIIWSAACTPDSFIQLLQGHLYVSYLYGTQVYHSCTFGTGTVGGFYLKMQNDGNLVLYTDFRTVLWSALTG